MVNLLTAGIFDFVFHLVELSRVDERGLLLPYSLTMNTPLRSITLHLRPSTTMYITLLDKGKIKASLTYKVLFH